ncbi:MAG: hypothetical protein SVO01_01005 [Thermotogota bacterium]|nr:hypothetical protein [Thermotogota bacterium]
MTEILIVNFTSRLNKGSDALLSSKLNEDFEDLLTYDFICRIVNSPKFFKKYIQMGEAKFTTKVVNR